MGLFPDSKKPVVHDAYVAAREAFDDWRKVSRFTRSDYMYRVSQIIERRREDLAKAISLETGKNYNESIAEVNEALHMAQFTFGSGRYSHGEVVSSEIQDKDSYMLRRPKGVIAIISPFNFPPSYRSLLVCSTSYSRRKHRYPKAIGRRSLVHRVGGSNLRRSRLTQGGG